MSILIKGMEMPDSCIDCEIKQYDDYENYCVCPFSGVVCLSIGRQDACPLVALPDKHGRLVDADATIKEIKARNPDDVSYEDAWAITCIEHAPTIEPEPHWIPCSRELPDTREFTSKTVLCCDKYGGIYTATYNKLGEWHDDAEYADLTDVIAWMPLPEPYREDEGC